MKAYKLLAQNLTSHNNTKWEISIPKEITTTGNALCSNQVLHYYKSPFVAVFFNSIHANISNPKLFEIEVENEVNGDGIKFGCKKQTILKEIELPVISTEQRIKIAILCAKKVYSDKKWNKWADNWLNNTDRSKESAYAAYYAAYAAAFYAAYAADAAVLYADAAADADAAAFYAAYAVSFAIANGVNVEEIIQQVIQTTIE